MKKTKKQKYECDMCGEEVTICDTCRQELEDGDDIFCADHNRESVHFCCAECCAGYFADEICVISKEKD